jgi:hypothetical protein
MLDTIQTVRNTFPRRWLIEVNGDARTTVARGGAPYLDGLWIGLFFLLVYEALRQTTVYGDGVDLLHNGWSNEISGTVHLLYPAVLYGLRRMLDPLGMTVYEIASHLSCVATAFGVALAHTGFSVLGFRRRDAILAAGLVGFSPGILFFATVVEMQSLLFGIAGLSFVAAARMAVRPTPGRAALLGLATGIAYCAHASGILLPVPLLLMVWTRGLADAETRARLPMSWGALTLVVGLTHLAVVWGVPFLLRTLSDSFSTTLGNAQGHVMNFVSAGHWSNLTAVIATVWHEWLLAFLPLSVLWVRAFFVSRTKWMGLALGIALVPYLATSILMLGGFNEHGAYLLPLAWPAAWVVLRCCPRPVAFGGLIVAAVISVVTVTLHDKPERSLAFAAGLRTVAAEEPVALLIGEYVDLEACFVRLPEVPYLWIVKVAYDERERAESLMPFLDEQLTTWFEEGRRVFLTSQVEALAQPGAFAGSQILDEVILAHLRNNYELVPVGAGGFSGKEIRRR